MQLQNLIKGMEDMSDEELTERLHELRHRREVIRPAAANRVRKEEKKVEKKATSGVEKLLAGLSPAELEALLASIDKGVKS